MTLRRLILISLILLSGPTPHSNAQSPVVAPTDEEIAAAKAAAEKELNDCKLEIKNHLDSKMGADFTREYFSLRAKLALHRVDYLHLTQLEKLGRPSPRKQLVKDSILSFLAEHEKKMAGDSEYAAAQKAFAEKSMSRITLARVATPIAKALRAVGADEAPPEESPFWLGVEDIKALEMLAELEAKNPDAPKAERMTNNSREEDTGILNLIQIIESSYTRSGKDVTSVVEQKDKVAEAIATLLEEVKKRENDLFDLIKNREVCKRLSRTQLLARVCTDCASGVSQYENRIDLGALLESALEEQMRKNNYKGMRYNEVWLHTDVKGARKGTRTALENYQRGRDVLLDPSSIARLRPKPFGSRIEPPAAQGPAPAEASAQPPVQPAPTEADPKEKVTATASQVTVKEQTPSAPPPVTSATTTQPTQTTPTTPTRETKEQATVGLPSAEIQNPETVILDYSYSPGGGELTTENTDKRKRWAEALLRENADKKQRWAQSLLRDEKYFLHEGNLFETKTGNAVKFTSEKPTEQEKKRELFAKNGKRLYSYAGALYRTDTNAEVELDEAETQYNKPKNIVVTPGREDKAYRMAQVVAVANGDSAFQAGQKYFRTGVNPIEIASPYARTNSHERERWVKHINSLPEEKKVLQHQRDTWDRVNAAACTETIIMNKKEGTLKIFDRETMSLKDQRSIPVVFGKTKGDAPTRFLHPERSRIQNGRAIDADTNGTTGAGEYVIHDIPAETLKGSQDPKEQNYLKYLNTNYAGRLARLCLAENGECLKGDQESVIAIHQYFGDKKELAARKKAVAAAKEAQKRSPASIEAIDAVRRSGGCINVSPEEFDAIKGNLKSECSVFVLPEEDGNRFEVGAGDRLRLVRGAGKAK